MCICVRHIYNREGGRNTQRREGLSLLPLLSKLNAVRKEIYLITFTMPTWYHWHLCHLINLHHWFLKPKNYVSGQLTSLKILWLVQIIFARDNEKHIFVISFQETMKKLFASSCLETMKIPACLSEPHLILGITKLAVEIPPFYFLSRYKRNLTPYAIILL